MSGQEEIGLPPSLATAWGRQARQSKGPKPGLSLARIVAAAVRVAGAEGLEAVSMARVAAELGFSTMSLYRYVAAKDELLLLMIDAAVGPPPATADEEGWREGLSDWAWTCRERYRQHPWALRIPITEPPRTPNQVAWLEHGLWSLRDTALLEDEKASVVLLLSGYVRNEAMLTADLRGGGSLSDSTMLSYAQLLRRLTDQERFPALHTLLAAGVFDKADPPEQEFSFGLERILDGIEALVRLRARR